MVLIRLEYWLTKLAAAVLNNPRFISTLNMFVSSSVHREFVLKHRIHISLLRNTSFLQIGSRVLNFSIFRLFVVIISILDTVLRHPIHFTFEKYSASRVLHELVYKLKVFSLFVVF